MVHGHFDNPVPEQKGSVRGEDPQESAHNLFPRIHRCVHVDEFRILHWPIIILVTLY